MHYMRFRLIDCNYFYCEEEMRYKYTIYKSFICNSVGENNSQSEFPTQKCFDLILLCKIIWCNIWGCFFIFYVWYVYKNILFIHHVIRLPTYCTNPISDANLDVKMKICIWNSQWRGLIKQECMSVKHQRYNFVEWNVRNWVRDKYNHSDLQC